MLQEADMQESMTMPYRHRQAAKFREDLAYRLWPLWLRRWRTGELIEALSLGLAAARLGHSERATGWMLTALADAARGVSSVAAYGYGRRAMAHCEQIGDAEGLAWALSGLGSTLLDADRIEQADACFRDAEALHAKLGHTRGIALARQGRGLVALERGDAETAVELLDGAHRALAETGDRYQAALSLAHHARALAADGDPQRALLELDLATAVMREMSATQGEALTLTIRAGVLRAAGQETAARDVEAAARALLQHADPLRGARLGDRPDAACAEPANPARPR
jgi:tetratricopeptide (TPR) repeat protein